MLDRKIALNGKIEDYMGKRDQLSQFFRGEIDKHGCGYRKFCRPEITASAISCKAQIENLDEIQNVCCAFGKFIMPIIPYVLNSYNTAPKPVIQ
jgi:hypothetical protein